MPTITKQDFVDTIADKTGVSQSTIKTVVQLFLDEITKELSNNNRIEFRDFGVFEVRQMAGRMAQNPKTMEPVKVPPKCKVKFKMGRIMKQKLNCQIQE